MKMNSKNPFPFELEKSSYLKYTVNVQLNNLIALDSFSKIDTNSKIGQ